MRKFKLLCLCLCLFSLHCVFAQTDKLTLSGTVTSSETKKPIQGANVVVKGSKKGIITDADGKFKIKAIKGQTVVISYVGFDPKEIKVTKEETVSVELALRVAESEEVVVVGYGTRKKSHLTGSVSKVTNENLEQIPVSRADEALMGKIAGVNITRTDAQAGAAPTIQIRGATSITAGTDPLIVIDGYPVPTDLSAIDMNDVESIEVLKDAASAAIYGSRGGNGVILITTKSGKAGKGKLTVNFSTGTKNVYRKIDFPSLQQWKSFVLQDNKGNIPAEITQAEKFDANTNAQDVIFRQVQYTNLQLGASGGNAQFKYYLSGTALFDNGVMIGNDYKRFGVRAGFSAKPSNKVTVEFGITPSITIFYTVPVTVQEALRTLPSWMPAYHNDTTAKYTGMPVGSIANMRDFNPSNNAAYGGINLAAATTNSPLQQLAGTSDKRTQIRNLTNLSFKVDFTRNFSFKSSLGFLYGENNREYFQTSWAQAEAALDGDVYARSTSKAILNKLRTLDVSNENIFSYKAIIKKHDVDLIGGFSEQYTNYNFFSGQAGNFATDDIPTLNAGTMQALTSTVEERSLVSLLFRANYAYDNKYLFSASIRRDASSRFGEDNRWGTFPAVSIGWKLSNEKFYPENNIIPSIKLRASYGATGNENIANYRYFANVNPTGAILGNESSPGVQLTSLPNQNLGWERTFSTNLGADIGLFNNKVTITLDHYKTETDKLLLDLPIVASSGFTTFTINQGKVQNSGFEFEVSAPVMKTKNFSWNVSFNGYTNKNKLLDFGGTDEQISQGDPKRANFFLTKVGQPLVQYYGYVLDSTATLYNTNYWPINVKSFWSFVKDINGDGKITDADRVVLGNPYPKFNWGFTTNFQYKAFDLSITLQGSHGAKVFNIDPYYFQTQFSTTGTTAYQSQGYNAQQLAMLRINSQTDMFIEDASFIALRNLNIGYNVQPKLVKKLGLKRLRAYMSSSNLWYKFPANYSSFNPEADNGFPNDPLRKGYQRGGVPLTRNITFGINIDFN